MNHQTTTTALALSVVFALTATASGVGQEPFDLLFASSYHGDEMPAHDGDPYLALERDGEGWELVEKPIRVTLVEDYFVDAPGQRTGKEVRVDGEAPLFLVRGNLTPGPVDTVHWESERLFGSPSFDWTLDSGRRYRLSVACPGPAEISPEARTRGEFPAAWGELCALSLRQGGRVQVLAELQVNQLHDSAARLIWAGDLDRDGRLDLLLDLSDHYNVSRPTLFLSSAATAGDMLVPVARLVITGC